VDSILSSVLDSNRFLEEPLPVVLREVAWGNDGGVGAMGSGSGSDESLAVTDREGKGIGGLGEVFRGSLVVS